MRVERTPIFPMNISRFSRNHRACLARGIAPLATGIAALLLAALPARAQTYTSPNYATPGYFSNPLVWNFGAGPVPASDAALDLWLQSFASITAADDLNLTLHTLNLATYGSGTLTASSALGGDYAFSGGAGGIHLLGSSAATVLSAPVVLGSGLTSLTIDGAGASGLTVSSVIASSAAGAPLIIATTAGNAGTGVVTLTGVNTFSGGVVVNSGTLSLGSARALGEAGNTLTINGGSLRSSSFVAVANNLALNKTLNFNSATGLALSGVLSSEGGVRVNATAAGTALVLSGTNTYTGATAVGLPNFATSATDGPGILRINGAAGSILGTSGIAVAGGGVFELNYRGGSSGGNARVSAGTAFTTQSGFVQVIGNAGLVKQSLGAVQAGGLTTILAGTAGVPLSSTEITIANLLRSPGGTVTFAGANLGAAAASAGSGVQQGNVWLTQINGAAPSAALRGGGGATGTKTISILPWALGDTSAASANYAAGTGFVTSGTNGVRLLNVATEYNTANNFSSVGATENMRITNTVTNPAAAATVNSLFFASTGRSVGGANPVTITSGTLASNVAAATITAPLRFGAGGTGEAVVSVVDALAGTANKLTLSGGFIAAALVKSGHGDLLINTVDPVIAGGISIDGGELRVDAVSRLGGATSITVSGSSSGAARAGLDFTHTTGTQTLAVPVITTGGVAGFTTASGGILALDSNISGTGGLSFDGAGKILLGGTNTYTGGTRIGSGGSRLVIDSDARLGSALDPLAGFVNLSGGTLRISANWNSARAIIVDNTSVLDTLTNTATLAGPWSGSGDLQKINAGTLVVTGADNGYTGRILLGTSNAEGGTVALSGAGALNSASVTFGPLAAGVTGTYLLDLSAATAFSGTPWRSFAVLETAFSFVQPHEIRLGASAAAPVDLRADSGAFGGTTGVITGFGKLVKVGTFSVLTLQTANTFTGGVEIWGGTLSASNAALGQAANTVTINGGTLLHTGDFISSRNFILGATPQPVIYGNLTLLGANATAVLANTIAGNGGTMTLAGGTISGPGGFNHTATLGAVLSLEGMTNTYEGDTQLTTGTVNFSSNANLGAAGSRLRMHGGTLAFTAAPGSPSTFVLPRTILITSAPQGGGSATTSTLTVTNANATLELSGPLVGGMTNTVLAKNGAGRLLISGNSPSFFGLFQIGSGSVRLASTGQIRRATVSLGSAAATFEMGGLDRELNAVNLAAGSTLALGAGGRLTTGFAGAMAWSGSVTGDSAASFVKAGFNTLSITAGAHTFGGGFHLLGGVTTLSGTGALPWQSAFTIGGWGDSANKGGRLQLDNYGTNLGTRLADTQTIHSNEGELLFAASATLASSETVGSLRGAGMTTVTISGGTLNFSDAADGLTRLHGGTFLFRSVADNLGTAAATPAIANITFGNLPGAQFLGGGGDAGTTGISILPYAVGAIGTFGTGSSFVTYGANGVRLLNTTTEVNPSLLAAGATENVRLANATLAVTTLTDGTDRTVNALAVSGTDGTTRVESAAGERLIIDSGLLLSNAANVFAVNAAGTAGVALGVQTAELQTGAGNTRELNVFTTYGDLALGAKVTTSGGLTKSGATQLFLTNAGNTYSGATTINAGSLVIDSLAALGVSSTLQIGGGFLKYRGGDAALAQGIVAAGGSATNDGGSAGFDISAFGTLTVAPGGVSGYGGILKAGSGVLKLTGANTQSGATIISGGALAIDNPAALGTNGRVVFGGGFLRFDAPMTLTQDFIGDAGRFGFDTNGSNVTLRGTLLGGAGLYKVGAGELNLTATEMNPGVTQIFGGTLRLSGANGSIVNSLGIGGFLNVGTVFVGPRSALVLDNSAVNNNNRLPDVWDTPFGGGAATEGRLRVSGGELKIIGHAAGTSERINDFTMTSGTVTLQGGGTVLTSGSFTASALDLPNIGLIRGDNLGSQPGATSTNWFLTDLGGGTVQLRGAGGAEGTPFINTLAGFMGDTYAAGVGTDFLTYATDTGFRPLAASEYAAAIPAENFDPNRAPNVALTGAATVNQTTTVSALKLAAGAGIGGGGALLVSTGTILATGSASFDVPSLSAFSFLTPGAGTVLTVGSVLPGSAIGKIGGGTLVLNDRAMGGSVVRLAEGTLRLGTPRAALSPLAQLIVAGTGTFDLGGSDRIIGTIQDDLTTTATTFGLGQIGSATIALGANRLILFYSASDSRFSGSITGTGGLTKAFSSTSGTYFSQPQSYTGSTIIRGGSFVLTGAATLATTAVEVLGGTLYFVNNPESSLPRAYLANRLGTSVPITLSNGEIYFSDSLVRAISHDLGPITLAGRGLLSMATTSASATVADLSRFAGRGTLTVSATNLGLAPSPSSDGSRVFLTQIEHGSTAAAFTGGGGAVGSTTQSILPWAWSSTASSFLTYGADGLRPLAASEYATDLNAPGGGVSANVRFTGVQSLTAPREVNALMSPGFISLTGAFDLTLGSGALTVAQQAGVSSIGVGTNNLLTGAGNTRELILQPEAVGSAMYLYYNVTTSGGVTKYGAGDLWLSGSNSFAGGLTINDGNVGIFSDAQLGAPGGMVRFGGATQSSLGLNYSGTGTLVFDRPIETTSFGNLRTNRRWVLNQPITGAGGISFGQQSAGVFEINAANTYTGPTSWNGGQLYIRGDSAFGSGGELLLNPSATTYNIILRGDWLTSRLIYAVAQAGLQTNGYDATWSGQFVGGAALDKYGNGRLALTEAMPYTGALTVNAGAVVLKDRGSIAANTGTLTVNAGAALTLDDTATHFSDRLPDNNGSITLRGALTLLGNSSVTTEEVISTLLVSPNVASTITVAPGSGQAAILRLAGTTSVGGTSLWRGTNLGLNAPGSADSASILLTPGTTGAFQLVGGSAPNGHPSVSIIRGGFGDTTASGLGTQFVTYDAVKGVRLLDPATEYTTTITNGSVVTDNVKADGTALALGNATTANALWLRNGGRLNGAGVLTLTSGNLLVTGTGNTISAPLDLTGTALSVGGSGDVTISGGISGSNSLFKQGAGTLTWQSALTSITRTVLGGGVIALGGSGVLLGDAFFQGGEIRNVSGAPLSSPVNLTLYSTMKVGGAQDISFTGPVGLGYADREINVTNTGVTTLSGVISSSQTLINYGLTKTGPGRLVLASAANTYDGETTVSEGELRVTGSIATSTLTTVRGGTLSGMGTVGKLTLQSGVLAPGTSVGTLNCGDLLFSGGLFAVEIASAVFADKMMVTGSAGLGASTELGLIPLALFDPQIGDTWVIVDNDGTDAFATGPYRFTHDGAPIEAGTPFAVGGKFYALNYHGGTGNDVVLTATVPEPGTAALLVAALPLLTRRRCKSPLPFGA